MIWRRLCVPGTAQDQLFFYKHYNEKNSEYDIPLGSAVEESNTRYHQSEKSLIEKEMALKQLQDTHNQLTKSHQKLSEKFDETERTNIRYHKVNRLIV